MRLEDLTVTETEQPRKPPQRGNLGETKAALAPECRTIVISVVEIVISSVSRITIVNIIITMVIEP